MTCEEKFLFSVPQNDDLNVEIANTFEAESAVRDILKEEGSQIYTFTNENLMESLKPLSHKSKENCSEVLRIRQRSHDDHKTLQSTLCSLENLESSLRDLSCRFKKSPILRRTFNTPYDLININAICEIIDDDNFLIKCFIDKDDFIILCFQKSSMEWDFHSSTFPIPDEIKNILTVQKNNSLFFLEIVDYFSKK